MEADLDPQKTDRFPPGIVFSKTFGDLDELIAFVPEKVRMTQLSIGPFLCHTSALLWETIWFRFSRLDRPIYATGEKHPDFLNFVCLPQGRRGKVISHGRSITEDCLYGFGRDRGVDMVFPAHTTHCAVDVRSDVFDACIEAMDRSDINVSFFEPNYIYLPETLPPLCTYLNQLDELLQQRSPLLQQPDFQEIVVRDFLPLLVSVLPLQQDRLKTRLKSFSRAKLVRQTEEYLRSNLDRPLTLTDLCSAMGTSERALSYGFQDIFGTSPMVYLKLLRLQSAYQALKTAAPDRTTVLQIAHRSGFWSLGHFARDYRAMFGELPRDTLGKSFD
jgi:AraC family transcriptional regulator, ethanolamine operon transcriptional activator